MVFNKSRLKDTRRNLRQDMTPAEKKLWGYLRGKNLNGLKFRRQHSVGRYALDFYCSEYKLCIELDGGIHNQTQEYDNIRTDFLNQAEIQVLRFSNDEILEDIDRVLGIIQEYISPLLGGDAGKAEGGVDRNKLLKSLRVYGKENHVPNITDENAEFLGDLIAEKNVQNLLEIGTANGYSAIVFGSILEQTGGKMLSIDFSLKSHDLATQNIKKAQLENTVELVFGNALDVLPTLEEKYDFIFIDGMKRRTKDFLQLVWDKVPTGGVIVIDDVIKFKDKMIGFYEYVESQDMDYEVIQIDSDDGIMVIEK